MQELTGEVRLGLNHVQVIVRAMHGVASCDGVHLNELSLIRAFYEQCAAEAGGLAAFDEVVAAPLDASEAREILDSPLLCEALLRSCVFTAFADGRYSAAERGYIRGLAEKLGVDKDRALEIEEQVRDHLLQQVARSHNLEALKEIAAELQAEK